MKDNAKRSHHCHCWLRQGYRAAPRKFLSRLMYLPLARNTSNFERCWTVPRPACPDTSTGLIDDGHEETLSSGMWDRAPERWKSPCWAAVKVQQDKNTADFHQLLAIVFLRAGHLAGDLQKALLLPLLGSCDLFNKKVVLAFFVLQKMC